MIPYGKDNWRRNADIARGTYLAAARLRPVPGRRARDRLVRRRRARRVHGGGDARRVRRGRVAGGAALVHRGGRDVGDQLRGVHLDPGRQAAAAAPAGDRADPGHRRPLPDRRPLHRRLRHAQRAEPVRGQPGRDERDAARSGVLGPGLARALAGAARGDAAVADRVAAPAARRAVLARRVPRARLRRDRGGRPQRRRLDGRVCRCGLPDAEEPHGAEPDDRRQLGPRPAVVGHARAEPRRAPRDGPVLRPLAEGHRERRRRGARDHLVRARVRRAGAVPGDVARADGARRAPIRIRRSERRDWAFAGGALPLVGGLVEVPVGAAATTPARTATPTVSTDTATGRRSGRAPPCRGAPADRRTGSRATCARTRRSARPTRPSRSTTRSRSSACPRCVLHLSASSPVATVVVRLDRRGARRHVGTGQRRDPQPDPSPVARPPGAAGAGTGRGRSASSCGRPATGSCPAIASASPWPRPRGP